MAELHKHQPGRVKKDQDHEDPPKDTYRLFSCSPAAGSLSQLYFPAA